MRFHSGRARMVVEILSTTEKKARYEVLRPLRDWSPMPWTMRVKFGQAKLRWKVAIQVEHENSTQVTEFDITTLTTLAEATEATKKVLDEALNGELEVYGAVVLLTVK